MSPIRQVLAAVDFSSPARGAFEHALALCARHSARLLVVHAAQTDDPFGWHAAQRVRLFDDLRRKAERAGVALEARIRHGDPVEVILMHARSLQPDVIVVGTHQRKGLERLGSSSVATRLAWKSTVPILVVPPFVRAGAIRPLGIAAVCVDFSPASKRAVEHATTWLAGPPARITLLHVVPGSASEAAPFARAVSREYQRHLARDAWRRLRDVVKPAPPVAVQARVLTGDPPTEIRRAANDIDADLLVVGVRKRGRLARALFGSTVARLLRSSPVPVLAIPEGVTSAILPPQVPERRAA